MSKARLVSAAAFVLLFSSFSSAHAVTIGRLPDAAREPEREKPRPSAPGAEDRYAKIHELFLKGDYLEAEREAGVYLSDPRSKKPDDILHLQALCLIKLGRGSEAREKLRRLERSAYAEPHRAAAAVSAADSYYVEGIYTSALEAYRHALERFPHSEEAAHVRARLAESSAKLTVSGAPLRKGSVEETPNR